VLPVDVVYLNPVLWCEVQPTVKALPLLPMKRFGHFLWGAGVMSSPLTPVYPVAIKGGCSTFDFDVPHDWHLRVIEQPHTFFGAEAPSFALVEEPVFCGYPSTGFVRMSSASPVAEF
jgi:hypothetical protein